MQAVVGPFFDTRQFAIPDILAANVAPGQVLLTYDDIRNVNILRMGSLSHPGSNFFYSLGNNCLSKSSTSEVIIGMHVLPIEHVPNQFMNQQMPVIVKIVDVGRLIDTPSEKNPFHEVAALWRLLDESPHISQLIVAGYDQSTRHLFTVMKYPVSSAGVCRPLSLFSSIDAGLVQFNEGSARVIFRQLMEGIRVIHGSRLAHRDMGLENVVLNHLSGHPPSLSVVDFASVYHLFDPNNPPPVHAWSDFYCIAPEVVSTLEFGQQAVYRMDPSVFDIWACGCLLFILVMGIPLFKIASPACENFRIVLHHANGLALILNQLPLSTPLKDLLCRILRMNPLERPRAEEILHHPWMTQLH